MIISQFRHYADPTPIAASCTWEELCIAFSAHERTTRKSSVSLWSPVEFRGDRSNANAVAVHCAVLDFDGTNHAGLTPTQAADLLEKIALGPYAAIVHTSFSHTEIHPKFRVIFPLAKPIPANDWARHWRTLADDWSAIAKPDAQCKDVCHQYYIPSAPPNEDPWTIINPGVPLTIVPRVVASVEPGDVVGVDRKILERVAKRWARMPGMSGVYGERLLMALRGEAYADAGERDVVTWEICLRLVREFRAIDGAAFAETMAPALERMGDGAPRDIAAKIERAREVLLAGDDRETYSFDANREHQAVDFVLAKLAETGRFYGFGGVLVEPHGDRLQPMTVDRLRSMASSPIDWRRETKDGPVKIGMPHTLAAAVLASPLPDAMPDVRGVAYAPIGELENGYDPETKYLVRATGVVRRTEEPAILAAELLELVQDFEWADDVSPGVWLAALLTLFARPRIRGPVPIFLFDKNTPGTGGTLVTQLLGEIYAGRSPGMSDYVRDREEWRKTLFSAVLEGAPLYVLDNVTGVFGDDLLNQIVTAGTISGRLLGKSQRRTLPAELAIAVNGVNLAPRGDLLRRCVRARLSTRSSAPERRGGFAIPALLEYVRTNRGRLAGAALALLDTPTADIPLEAFGSFEAWAPIRRIIVALGLPDPATSREALAEVAADVGEAQVPGLLIDVLAFLGAKDEATAITAVELLRDGGRAGAPFAAALSLLPEKTGARDLAMLLRRYAEHVFPRGILRRGKVADGFRKWYVDAR